MGWEKGWMGKGKGMGATRFCSPCAGLGVVLFVVVVGACVRDCMGCGCIQLVQ
jgi:hypothetical protein